MLSLAGVDSWSLSDSPLAAVSLSALGSASGSMMSSSLNSLCTPNSSTSKIVSVLDKNIKPALESGMISSSKTNRFHLTFINSSQGTICLPCKISIICFSVNIPGVNFIDLCSLSNFSIIPLSSMIVIIVLIS